MARYLTPFLSSCLLLFHVSIVVASLEQKAHIVYMGDWPRDVHVDSIEELHTDLLSKVIPTEEEKFKHIKSFNPTWSPAAIQSALITTTYITNSTKNADAEFAYGAGHVNQLAALHPGLVYDANEGDYVKFLCGEGYTPQNLRMITGDSSKCTSQNNGTVFDLNYPTFALSVPTGKPFYATYHRTVTNAGTPNSTYQVNVSAPPAGLHITVEPPVLYFESLQEKKSYVVKLQGETNTTLSAALIWSDGKHNVRSPILVYEEPNSRL